MIKDQDIAKQISDLMLEFGAKLDESVNLVHKNCSKKEQYSYRRAVGKVMGNMLTEIMNPLYGSHPRLKPKELF